MIIAKIRVNGAIARTVYRKAIPAGIIGAQVEFDYADDIWHGLRKTVVFKGAVTKDVVTDANIVTIPHEVVEKPSFRLSIGVYGVDADGNIAIPTLWEDIGAILDAADPSGDTNTDPSLPVWAQIQAMIGNLDELETTARDNLVAAVNEVAQSGGSASIEMRVDGGFIQYSTDEGETWVNLIAKSDLAGAGVPDGGTAGQLLSKTETGTEWIDPPQSGVQPDWNQNDSTAADYVKNRPFYTGDPVETVLVEETTAQFSGSNGLYMAEFPPTFEATVGDTYKVSWDGTVYECTCVFIEGAHAVGNLSIIGSGSDTGEPFVMGVVNGQGMFILTRDTSASHTFSISGFVTEVVKIDDKYLPENIATKSDVEVVQTTAENAQTTAENAQTTADSNKKKISELFESVAKFTFDKQTSGRDTFKFNAFKYYKISDFNPAPEDVISFKGTAENGNKVSGITTGNNCVEYGFFIVVASAGRCSITFDSDGEPVTKGFTAPSAGLYARYGEGNMFMTAGTGEFTLKSIDGLTIKSSTYGSTKKFRITVDDSGTISATEVV